MPQHTRKEKAAARAKPKARKPGRSRHAPKSKPKKLKMGR